jgi:hypothetical protein
MAEGVLIDGKYHDLRHPITGFHIPVFGLEDHKMEFKPGDGHNKERTEDITLGVVHWTGSENALETMFRVLNGRDLGVEYAISPYGSLYQFCDMMRVDTADAGAANKISWGVEVVNAGIRRMNTLWREPRYRKIKMGPRHAYDTRIHDRKVRCWDFYPAQTATLCALNKLIADVVPSYGPAVSTQDGVIDFKSFVGAVGHLNVSRGKIDPGTLPMENLDHFMRTGELPSLVREAA